VLAFAALSLRLGGWKRKDLIVREEYRFDNHLFLRKDGLVILNLLEALATIKRTLAECVTGAAIEAACRAENYTWRRRQLGPAKTVQAFIMQILHGNTACSHTIRLANLNCSPTAYCQARAQLPLAVYQRLLADTSRTAQHSCRTSLWRGHRTFLVDGSSFSMPDTPELQAHFGQPGGQRAGCGFPTAHWLTMFDAESGLLVEQMASPLRTHDMSQVAALHPALQAGDVLVGDTAFSSYAHLALLQGRKLHGVFRAHQRQLISFRKDRKLRGKLPGKTVAQFATGRLVAKLGKHDQIVIYDKPKQRPTWMTAEAYAELPDELMVRELRYHAKQRGGRTRVVTLVTTLLDPIAYPAEAIAALYGERWTIETNLGHLKTSMGLDVLHCKTVAGVLKELTIYALVYNLTRMVMVEAAERQQVAAERISFIDALRWLAQACERITPLELTVNPRRPNRHEPRVRKRRPKQFPLMTKPRQELRKQLYAKRDAA
jgi:Transposase DDE domain